MKTSSKPEQQPDGTTYIDPEVTFLRAEIAVLKAEIAKLQNPNEAWLKQKLNDIANGRKV